MCTPQDHKHEHIVLILDKKPKLLFSIENKRVLKMHQPYITSFMEGVGGISSILANIILMNSTLFMKTLIIILQVIN